MIVSHVIVLFDFIEEMHEKGEPFEQAILDAGIERLRPVLITVIATTRADSAHQSRGPVVAAAVLRADRRPGRRDLHHAAAGSGALQHRRIGFEDREMGNKTKGGSMKMQEDEDIYFTEATEVVLDQEALARLAYFFGRSGAARMIHLTRTGSRRKQSLPVNRRVRGARPLRVREKW